MGDFLRPLGSPVDFTALVEDYWLAEVATEHTCLRDMWQMVLELVLIGSDASTVSCRLTKPQQCPQPFYPIVAMWANSGPGPSTPSPSMRAE